MVNNQRMVGCKTYLLNLIFTTLLLPCLVTAQVYAQQRYVGSESSVSIDGGGQSPLESLLAIAEQDRVPLGLVLISTDCLSNGVPALKVDGKSFRELLSTILLHTNYRWSEIDGVFVVLPQNAPLSVKRVLEMRFHRFKTIPTSMQGIGVILNGYISSQMHPEQGYLGNIITSSKSQPIPSITLDDMSVEGIADTVVKMRGKGVWVLQNKLSNDGKLSKSQLHIFEYFQDTEPIKNITCDP